MVLAGQKYGSWMVLKPSGHELWEISNGKKVIRVSTENIEAGKYEGELMVNLAQPEEKAKLKVEKKATVKKPAAKAKPKAKAKTTAAVKKKGK